MIVSDIETRVRTYLNEAVANFYTQAEIWKWISTAARDISEKALCVRRILTSATGGNNVRRVTTNAYKVMHVEYVAATRTKMLTKMDPLKLGHYPLNGTAPQGWYEYGNTIGIEPLPDAVYSLRLYVADIAKLKTESVLDTDWTAGAGWTLGDTAVHAGASTDLTLTAGVTQSTNYTFEFEVTGVGTGAYLNLYGGSVTGSTISTNGWHTQTIVPNSTTFKMTAYGDITVNSMTIYKQADISAGTDELELFGEWDHHLALYATYSGLIKNRNYNAAALLMSLYSNEIDYLRQTIVEVIPDGREDMVYQ